MAALQLEPSAHAPWTRTMFGCSAVANLLSGREEPSLSCSHSRCLNTHMVELTASGDADQVEARLREALDAHGLQLFARIDHAAGARKADVELEANVLLIFGNTRVGTPLMQADPRVGIELPLRMLIWQAPDGTHVGYLDPRELADRYALDGHQQTLERQTAVLSKLAAAAAS